MVRVLLFENISLAFSSILANKMRALLTMLGIIIGIGSVIAIQTVGNSLTNGFTSEMEGMGANNVTVMIQQKADEEDKDDRGMSFMRRQYTKKPLEEDYMTDEMVEDLKESLPGEVKDISLDATLCEGTIQVNGKEIKVAATGYNDRALTMADLNIVAGKSLGAKEQAYGKGVAILSDYAAQKLYRSEQEALGKTIELTAGGNFYEVVIIGVYEYKQESLMFNANDDPTTTLYLPLKYVQSKNHVDGYQKITVVAEAGSDNNKLQADIREVLDRYYHSNDNFAPATISMASMVDSMKTMLGTISLAISIIAGIALLVGGIGVMNIMLVSISERTREIGTRKALGATNGSIRVQFIVESMILCLIGGVFGIILGIAGGSFAATKMGYDAAPSVSSIVLSVGFSLAIGVFFGYYPANKAAKMNPIDALRYE